MPYERTIICLAASWRPDGLCIAGRVYEDGRFGDWVRPVSHRATMEINDGERRKDNARLAEVPDVVTMSFDSPAPTGHQTENHLISEGLQWRHDARLRYNDVLTAVDGDRWQDLWGVGSQSRGHKNNKVEAGSVFSFNHSLVLIEVNNFELIVDWHPRRSGRRYRGAFGFQAHDYILSVTDPWISARYRRNDTYLLKDVVLCLSLGDKYKKGVCYKLIAAVVTPERNWIQ